MSGLALRFTPDVAVPPATIRRAFCLIRIGLVKWERESILPRELRAVGSERWIATADHRSRLARFEYTSLNLLFTADLSLPSEVHEGLCQIVPEGTPSPVTAARYSRHTLGLVRIEWNLATVTAWHSEGIGVHYGVDPQSRIQALLFSGMQIRLR